jgi:cytochrome P450
MNQTRLVAARAPLIVDPATLAEDPHARFAELRENHALIQLGEGQYMALRAEHVLPLLTDPRTTQIEGKDYVRLRGIPDGATARLLRDLFLFANGDAHRSRRGLFGRSFAHSTMRDMQTEIRSVADAIVSDLPRGTSFDFVARMAARVPADMIAGILGLPRADAPYFASRVCELAPAVAPIYPIEDHQRIEEAAGQLFDYVGDHMVDRLVAPRDDMLSSLVASWHASQEIPFDSLVHQVLGIIIGGTDTTRAAFAMLVALLLDHPEQWAAIRDDPSLIHGAVSEAMRFDPSVGSIPRFTTADLEIGDITLPAGVAVLASTMSAMRDPTLYLDPDRFDIRRDHPRLHPVFGNGPHRCIGQMLARLEMQEGLAALISAAPGIELETAPRMTGFGGIRQITPMLVQIP